MCTSAQLHFTREIILGEENLKVDPLESQDQDDEKHKTCPQCQEKSSHHGRSRQWLTSVSSTDPIWTGAIHNPPPVLSNHSHTLANMIALIKSQSSDDGALDETSKWMKKNDSCPGLTSSGETKPVCVALPTLLNGVFFDLTSGRHCRWVR